MYRICLFTNSADTSLRSQTLHACNPHVSSFIALSCVMNKLQFSLYVLAHLVMCSKIGLRTEFPVPAAGKILDPCCATPTSGSPLAGKSDESNRLRIPEP